MRRSNGFARAYFDVKACGARRTLDLEAVALCERIIARKPTRKRVVIIGSCGAGKSTFARRLGAALKREVTHLDALFWRPGWVETPREEWRAKIEELLREDSWILDGNYAGALDMRLAACDTAIFLDLPRRVCLWRVIKRSFQYRNAARPCMNEGCREKLDWNLIKWVLIYPRREMLRKLEAHSKGKRILNQTTGDWHR